MVATNYNFFATDEEKEQIRKEKRKAVVQKYYKNNKGKIEKTKATWNKKNKDKVNARQRENYHKNKEEKRLERNAKRRYYYHKE